MKYNNIVKGKFIDRPNRFIANVEIEGEPQIVHVKNTGRCREILLPDAEVFLQKSDNPNRKTKFDLVKVKKGDRIVNMDSQAPNKVVQEWLTENGLYDNTTTIIPEKTYHQSRFDFYIEGDGKKAWMEVKGVTLEVDGAALFPDAPSERAVKHIEHLMKAKKEGYEAYIMFVIQMEGVKYFSPNWATHPEFSKALIRARDAGVMIMAYDCIVTETELRINKPIRLYLDKN
ncbi:MAG: DNA/RNA nuclease SfsA [Eubacterium sp.]